MWLLTVGARLLIAPHSSSPAPHPPPRRTEERGDNPHRGLGQKSTEAKKGGGALEWLLWEGGSSFYCPAALDAIQRVFSEQ